MMYRRTISLAVMMLTLLILVVSLLVFVAEPYAASELDRATSTADAIARATLEVEQAATQVVQNAIATQTTEVEQATATAVRSDSMTRTTEQELQRQEIATQEAQALSDSMTSTAVAQITQEAANAHATAMMKLTIAAYTPTPTPIPLSPAVSAQVKPSRGAIYGTYGAGDLVEVGVAVETVEIIGRPKGDLGWYYVRNQNPLTSDEFGWIRADSVENSLPLNAVAELDLSYMLGLVGSETRVLLDDSFAAPLWDVEFADGTRQRAFPEDYNPITQSQTNNRDMGLRLRYDQQARESYTFALPRSDVMADVSTFDLYTSFHRFNAVTASTVGIRFGISELDDRRYYVLRIDANCNVTLYAVVDGTTIPASSQIPISTQNSCARLSGSTTQIENFLHLSVDDEQTLTIQINDAAPISIPKAFPDVASVQGGIGLEAHQANVSFHYVVVTTDK